MTTLLKTRPQFQRRCSADAYQDLIQALWSRPVPHRSVVERSGVGSPTQDLDQSVRLAQEYRRYTPTDLLTKLNSHFGIEWNEIAKVTGVSRQAVAKWRNGQASPDGRRFRTLCKLAAFAHLNQRRGADPALWLKTRLQVADERESHLSISDVLSTGNFRLALQHFDREISDRDLLREVFPRYSTAAEGPATIALRDGVFVISLDELGLFSAADEIEEAQEDLLVQVRDYINDWHGFLCEQEPHASRHRIVTELAKADRDSSLADMLFGR